MFRLTIAIGFCGVLAGPALAAPAPECEIDRPVVFAGLDYDSAQFHEAVAGFIISHGYVCAIEKIPGTVIPLINGLARGDADIIMEIWTANPAQAWVDAETAGTVVRLGTTFPDAAEGWYVPSAIVSGDKAVAPELQSVADIERYKELFADPEEPGKARFYNCPAGWQCEIINSKKLIAYGLDDSFTNFRPGTGEALAAAAEAAALRQQPILFYHWSPTWLLGKHDFTRLEEPEFDPDVWDAMLAEERPSAATAYPVSRVIIGANKVFTEAAPELAAFLAAYSSTSAATSAALAYMQESGASAEDAALHYLKENRETWAAWLPQEVAERVAAALR